MKLFKKKKYREEEYMYSSAKLASMSRSLIGDDSLVSLCSCDSAEKMFERLPEFGIHPEYTGSRPDIEKTLTLYLAGRYSELAGFLPDSEPAEIMRSRYDCHNLKAAIKCRVLGIPAEPFFISCGSVSPQKIEAMTESGDYSSLSPAFAEAAAAAREAADALAPARYSDALLDRACFANMKDAADRLGCEPVSSLLSFKADLTNFVTALRILRMKNPNAAGEMKNDSFVPGGKIDSALFAGVSGASEAFSLLGRVLSEAEAERLAPAVSAGDVDRIGAEADRLFLRRAAEFCRRRLIGIYPVIDYMIKLEYGQKNLRIIYYGLESGKSGPSIGEELRLIV